MDTLIKENIVAPTLSHKTPIAIDISCDITPYNLQEILGTSQLKYFMEIDLTLFNRLYSVLVHCSGNQHDDRFYQRKSIAVRFVLRTRKYAHHYGTYRKISRQDILNAFFNLYRESTIFNFNYNQLVSMFGTEFIQDLDEFKGFLDLVLAYKFEEQGIADFTSMPTHANSFFAAGEEFMKNINTKLTSFSSKLDSFYEYINASIETGSAHIEQLSVIGTIVKSCSHNFLSIAYGIYNIVTKGISTERVMYLLMDSGLFNYFIKRAGAKFLSLFSAE
jgi:hypothetical protein